MTASDLALIDRRMAIGGALAGVAGLALPSRQSRVLTQRGMVGGGSVQIEQREANFSLFVSRMIFPGDDPEVVVGSIIWVDDARQLSLRSTEITEYIVPEVEPEKGVLRRIFGTMRDDTTQDEYPFELEIVDVDLPGTGKEQDTVVLKVGNGARTSETATPGSGIGFSYSADGTVATGDIQELDLEIDLEAHEVSRDGKVVHLTPIEFDLLRVLAHHRGKLVTHRQLLHDVWGPAYETETHYLRVHIAHIRAKIEPDPSRPTYVITEPGVGYRLRDEM